MNISIRQGTLLVGVLMLGVFTFFALPSKSQAVGLEGDMQCKGTAQCPLGMGPGNGSPCGGPGGGTIGKTCTDMTSGFGTTGTCISTIPPKCKAVSTGGKDGFGLDKVAQLLGPLLQQLMKGSPSSGSPAPTTPTTGSGDQGCTQYYQVSVPTTDKCAYYVPAVSSSLTGGGTTGANVSDQLLNALGGSTSNTDTNTDTNTNTNISDVLNSLDTTTSVTSTTTSTTTAAQFKATVVNGTTTIVNLLPGVRGDIQTLGNGATVLAGSRDNASNSETAGFYGNDTLNGQSQGIVGSLCQSRPWATNFLSNIIPPTFFDGLCSLRGYQVGTPVKTTPAVTVVQSVVQKVVPKTVATSTVSTVPAKVDIWAVPATVPLGSRTSVFWNTQGVTSCTETSPDGSFSQSTLSGGASTVALTGATTFTISCLAPDGSHVTDYVTVNLAI